jgi:hypothetical protein
MHGVRKGPVEKLAFPTLQQNTSPFQQLGAFLLVLGRKIDNAQAVKAGNGHVHPFEN